MSNTGDGTAGGEGETRRSTSDSRLQLPILDLSVDRYAAFTLWKETFDDYVLLTDFESQSKKIQAARLRFAFSTETRKIYNSLSLTAEQKEDPEHIIKTLEKFAKGIINECLERHQFNGRQQEEGEVFDNYITELKILSTNCGFCVNCFPGLLRDRIIGGIRSDVVRKCLLAEKDLTIEKTVEICRSYEVADTGMETLRKDRDVDRIGISNRYTDNTRDRAIGRGSYNNNRGVGSNNGFNRLDTCKFCLRKHRWGKKYCPAWLKKCSKCGKDNHFSGSEVCKETEAADAISIEGKRHERELREDVDALFLGSIEEDELGLVVDSTKKFEININAPKGIVKFKVDTGADVTVIGPKELGKFNIEMKELQATKKTLKGQTIQK